MKINIILKDNGFTLYGCRYWDFPPRTGDWIELNGPKHGKYLIISSSWSGGEDLGEELVLAITVSSLGALNEES